MKYRAAPLSPYRWPVALRLFREGKDTSQIAEQMRATEAAVYNTLLRARTQEYAAVLKEAQSRLASEQVQP